MQVCIAKLAESQAKGRILISVIQWETKLVCETDEIIQNLISKISSGLVLNANADADMDDL